MNVWEGEELMSRIIYLSKSKNFSQQLFRKLFCWFPTWLLHWHIKKKIIWQRMSSNLITMIFDIAGGGGPQTHWLELPFILFWWPDHRNRLLCKHSPWSSIVPNVAYFLNHFSIFFFSLIKWVFLTEHVSPP